MIPWGFLQLASEMRPYTPSTEQGADGFMKYAVETEIMEERWESIMGSGEKRELRGEAGKEHVPKAADEANAKGHDRGLKAAVRGRPFLLPTYNLVPGQARVENCTELAEEIGIQMDEARVKLRSESENDVLSA